MSAYTRMYPNTPATTSGFDIKQTVVDLSIIYIFYFCFQKILEILCFPFKLLFATNSLTAETVAAKHQARNDRLLRIREQALDPLHEFMERFINHPENYKSDPDNAKYNTWYKAFCQGKVIDSSLRWAPMPAFKSKIITYNFLKYMKNQVKLHIRASGTEKSLFSRSLKRFYPELPSELSELEAELVECENEYREREIRLALGAELEALGLPETACEFLLTLKSEEVRPTIAKIKSYLDKGHSYRAAEAMIKYDYKGDIGDLDVYYNSVHAAMVNAWLDGSISWQGFLDITKDFLETVQMAGKSDYNRSIFYCTIALDLVEKQIKKERLSKYGK